MRRERRVLVAAATPGQARRRRVRRRRPRAPGAGLTRKLPHYHKYSYLAFEGDEPVNVDKGRWPVTRSPMTGVADGTPPMAKPAPREPLAELPPGFSVERMMRRCAHCRPPR
jgi:hypothetical protein